MENNIDNVFNYIIREETAYQTTGVPVVDGYEFKMYEHIRLSTLYKNGQLAEGNPSGLKPIKNIIRPILNVAYRSEGFDVKDIEPYVDDKDNYYKSFLVRKYHDRWARKNNLDTIIDDSVETYIDNGLILLKNTGEKTPEVVPLQRISFCDQTDVLTGSICEKHSYSPDQLLEFSGTWDADKIDEAITLSKQEKDINQQSEQTAKTPGKYIEVYELHGMFPESWLNEDGDPDKYSRQMHIVTFTKSNKEQDRNKSGITLYKGKEKKDIYKSLKRDAIYGRACGYGGIEELIEAQVWTTYNFIQIKKLLDVASDIIIQTEDSTFATRNKLTDREPGEIVVHKPGMPLTQVQIQPINLPHFENLVNQWEVHARTTGSANDAQLGLNPTSGTPFALQNLVTATGQGIHEYRRGKIAQFWSEVYRDWILPKLVSEMNQGDSWIEELDLDELNYVAEKISTTKTNRKAIDMAIKYLNDNGEMPTQEELETFKEATKSSWIKDGNRKFIEIAEGELKKIPIDVMVNIAGKQKDLSSIASGLTNIFRQIFSAPQVLQNPGMADLFNQIVESAGFSPVNFQGLEKLEQPQMQPQQVQQPQMANSINQ